MFCNSFVLFFLLIINGRYLAHAELIENRKLCESPSLLNDTVTCKRSGCEYSIPSNACLPPYQACKNGIGLSGCRRANAYYVKGGVTFHSVEEVDRGNCGVKSVPLALNFGGTSLTDSRGIKHVNEWWAKVHTDEDATRTLVQNEETQCPSGSGSDWRLYFHQIIGRTEKWGSGRCISYHAEIPGDGKYELSIKTAESFIAGGNTTRQFNIRLNGMVVVPEFNIRNYVRSCTGMELIIEFEVKDDRLTASGFPPRPMCDKRINIGFCYGDGTPTPEYDPNYLVSAFYLAELEGGPWEGNAITHHDICTDKVIPTTNCGLGSLIGKPGDCEEAGCAFSSSYCSCQPKYQYCRSSPSLSGCRRPNVFYNGGGQLCYHLHDKDQGNCQVEKVILAVNAGCNSPNCSYNDTRGIPYKSDSESLFTDADKTRNVIDESAMAAMCKKNTSGFGNSTGCGRKLYATGIQGDKSKAAKRTCLYYHVDLSEDGRYELSIKSLGNKMTNNHFNIRLNELIILEEFQVQRYARHCEGVEIITEFKVEDGILTTSGGAGQPIPQDCRVSLGFCYGNKKKSKDYDPSYMINAFYIAKLAGADTCKVDKGNRTCSPITTTTTARPGSPGTGAPPSLTTTTARPGSVGTGAPTSLTTAMSGMSSISTTSTSAITTTTSAPPTFVTDRDPKSECALIPSKYNEYQECVDASCTPQPYGGNCIPLFYSCSFRRSLTGCRRANVFYAEFLDYYCYSNMTEDDGDCVVAQVLIAVNLGGDATEDSRGIKYSDWNDESLFTDKDKTRSAIKKKQVKCPAGVTNIHPKEQYLYNTQMISRAQQQEYRRCITYHANISEPGFYEMSVKTAETIYKEGVTKRRFNVWVNDVDYWAELDIRAYSNFCRGMETILEFEYTKDGTLKPNFKRAQRIINGKLDIKFCYGYYKEHLGYDPNFLVSAFYFAKIE